MQRTIPCRYKMQLVINDFCLYFILSYSLSMVQSAAYTCTPTEVAAS